MEMQARALGGPHAKADRVANIGRVFANDTAFVVLMFVISRALILTSFLAIAPHLAAPINGISPVADWKIFAHWDGGWFRTIVTDGYDFTPDHKEHSIAFFPLYPLVVSAIVRLGIAFETVAPLVSNALFLIMLFVVFDWIRTRHGVVVARWTVGTLALLPTSIFGAVAYSESLFMLTSALALRDFERDRPLRAGFWAALASATRFAGIGLAVGFALDAIKRRRPARAWLSIALAPLGVVAFMAFQYASFHDPIAFIQAQNGWHKLGALSKGWWYVLKPAMIAHGHWIGVLLFVAAAIWYARERRRLGMRGDAELGYASTAFALILAAGDPWSTERYAWATLPCTIALAFVWQRIPALGFATLVAGSGELVLWSVKFA